MESTRWLRSCVAIVSLASCSSPSPSSAPPPIASDRVELHAEKGDCGVRFFSTAEGVWIENGATWLCAADLQVAFRSDKNGLELTFAATFPVVSGDGSSGIYYGVPPRGRVLAPLSFFMAGDDVRVSRITHARCAFSDTRCPMSPPISVRGRLEDVLP